MAENVTKPKQKLPKLPKLERGDIVLIRHKRSVYRYFLRRLLGGSYWDHAALLIYPAEFRRGRFSHVIAESIRTGLSSVVAHSGVKIHKLEFYLSHPEKYDVGVKRVRDLTPEQKIRATHLMLMNVDAPYWPWGGLTVVVAAYWPRFRVHVLAHERFSCSSIIQKAFYDSVNWDEKQKILFKEGVWSPMEHQELTTVADIARTHKTEWIYNEH